MKKTVITLTGILLTFAMFAQAPNGINYQAVARDANGNILAKEPVEIEIDILYDSPGGTSVYNEVHNDSTNQFGLVNLVIGQGETDGVFNAIRWELGRYFLQIKVNGMLMGKSQLLSVPYAKFADKAGNAFSGDFYDLSNQPDLSGYITEEIDPIYSQSIASDITASDTTRWGLSGGFSGDYNDLTNKPDLGLKLDTAETTTWDKDITDDFSGNFNDLNNIPMYLDTDSTDDFSGNYEDLNNLPDLGLKLDTFMTANWDKDKADDFSGDYNDLENKPTRIDTSDVAKSMILQSANGTKYKLEVDDYGNFKSTPINIDYYVTISSPSIEDSILTGSIFNIIWNDNLEGNVKIDLYKDSVFQSNIVSSTESTGNYEWTVPEDLIEAEDYSIKITSIEKDTVYAISNEFKVKKPVHDITFGDGTLPEGWTTSGAQWFVSDVEGDGDNYSLQSGEYNIDDIASVSFSKNFSSDGKLSFMMKRLEGAGIITLYIDNDYAMSFDASTDWKEFKIWIPSGNHAFKFETERTANSTTSEATFIDNISYLPGDDQLELGLYYQGGIIFDINSQKTHGLISSCTDLDYNGDYKLEWGCYGTEITSGNGADSESDGFSNTQAILIDCHIAGIAARVCDNYSVTVMGITFDDWYLPSNNEISTLLKQKSLIINLASGYWSSTETSSNYAHYGYWEGDIGDQLKSNDNIIRAIRSF